MSDKVIVLVADDKFLPHVKSLAVNCRRQGEFTGDFLLIHPNTLDVSSEVARGFFSLPVPDRGFLQKFNLFHPFLKRWQQALFLDADCMVQRPLSLVFDQLSSAPLDESGQKVILADKEEVPVFMGWQVWDKAWREHEAIYAGMNARFPHVFSNDKMFNTSMIAWEPASIPDDTVDQLRALQAEYLECNRPENGGTDEPIIDLLLHTRIRLMPRKLFVYWGLDFWNARVPSEGRGWDGTEIPAVLHYARWHAPWIVKTPRMDAYDNDRIGSGIVCHEFYQKNLSDFNSIFPRT